MLIIQVQCPIYKFIYPESEPVLLAGDTSERQSLTFFLSFFLPIRLNLRGGHQTGFGIQVQRGGGGGVS